MAWDVDAEPVQPQAAIDWFRRKLALEPADFAALTARAQRQAFTVSGATSLAMVQQVLTSIQTALENGETFESWQQRIPADLNKAWGKTKSQRSRITFDTVIQSAYGAGRWYAAQESERPYWKLEAVLDGRTSAICMKVAGFTARKDDPAWKKLIPPLHFRCRTALITLSSEQAQEQGITTKAPEIGDLSGFGLEPSTNEWTPNPSAYDPELYAAYQKAITHDRKSETMYGKPRQHQLGEVTYVRELLRKHATELRAHLGLDYDVTLEDIYDVAGFPNDVKQISIGAAPYRDGIEVILSVRAQGTIAEMIRTVQITSDPMIYNESFSIIETAQGSGFGSRVLAHQIIKAQQLGFNRIETKATRSAIANGYYTWVRLGFDAPLEEYRQARLRPTYLDITKTTMPNVNTLQDLLELPSGKDVWQQAGSSINVTFDLSKDSRSMQVLQRYITEKGIKIAEAW